MSAFPQAEQHVVFVQFMKLLHLYSKQMTFDCAQAFYFLAFYTFVLANEAYQ